MRWFKKSFHLFFCFFMGDKTLCSTEDVSTHPYLSSSSIFRLFSQSPSHEIKAKSIKMSLLNPIIGVFTLCLRISWSSAITVSQTALLDSTIQFSCVSSFPPSWMWFASKHQRPKTLTQTGTKPHPNLKDPRFTFTKRENEYFLRLSNIKSTDAGKYVCDGEEYQQFELNVVR